MFKINPETIISRNLILLPFLFGGAKKQQEKTNSNPAKSQKGTNPPPPPYKKHTHTHNIINLQKLRYLKRSSPNKQKLDSVY